MKARKQLNKDYTEWLSYNEMCIKYELNGNLADLLIEVSAIKETIERDWENGKQIKTYFYCLQKIILPKLKKELKNWLYIAEIIAKDKELLKQRVINFSAIVGAAKEEIE